MKKRLLLLIATVSLATQSFAYYTQQQANVQARINTIQAHLEQLKKEVAQGEYAAQAAKEPSTLADLFTQMRQRDAKNPQTKPTSSSQAAEVDWAALAQTAKQTLGTLFGDQAGQPAYK